MSDGDWEPRNWLEQYLYNLFAHPFMKGGECQHSMSIKKLQAFSPKHDMSNTEYNKYFYDAVTQACNSANLPGVPKSREALELPVQQVIGSATDKVVKAIALENRAAFLQSKPIDKLQWYFTELYALNLDFDELNLISLDIIKGVSFTEEESTGER
jgi:hypothetical protein